MRERNGVRIGQPVRDLDGKPLGQVDRLYESAFRVVKGFPILFRQEQVLLYEEVRAERDGELVVARSDRALFQLAEGGIPDIWRIRTPPSMPGAATPSEARDVFAGLAAARGVAPRAPAPPPGAEPIPRSPDDEREYAGPRGESFPAGPPPQP